MCLYCSSELINLNSSSPYVKEGCALYCPPGSLAWASDPARPFPFLFFFQKNKRKRKRFMIFFGIFILRSDFFFDVVKNINLVFRIPGFWRNATNLRIYQKIFSCVLHTANILICFERSFKKKILEVLKMCFRMDFLNTTKIIFLHFWILQHVCKTPKGIGQY
jgi:hypothetical protein